MQYSFMFHHPEFDNFLREYDRLNGGSVQSQEFARTGKPAFRVRVSMSHLSMFPQRMIKLFEDYLNGEYGRSGRSCEAASLESGGRPVA